MFEAITESEERGQVGIGTLIVFIAMVLVAAIAAGVLINTAGFLQTQAEATGEDSTALVSERINVNSEVGIVASGAETLDELRIAVTGAPGADQIDLAETTLQVVGPGGQENLVFTDGNVTAFEVGPVNGDDLDDETSLSVTIGNIDRIDGIDTSSTGQNLTIKSGGNIAYVNNTSLVNEDTLEITNGTAGNGTLNLTGLDASSELNITLYNNSTVDGEYLVVSQNVTLDGDDELTAEYEYATNVSDLNANEFAVWSTGDSTFVDEPVLSENEDYTIVANPDAGAFQDGNTAFGQGDDATIDIVSPAGATTRIELNAPDLFSEVGEAVLL